MLDFYNLNLWMFILLGALGYALCWFRWRLIWWTLPVVFFICLAYPFAAKRHVDSLVEYDPATLMRIGFSMLVAVVGPILGAWQDYRNRNPKTNNLP